MRQRIRFKRKMNNVLAALRRGCDVNHHWMPTGYYNNRPSILTGKVFAGVDVTSIGCVENFRFIESRNLSNI